MNPRPTRRHVLAAAAAVVVTAKASSVAAASGDTVHTAFGPTALADHIADAAREFGVPREILLAIAYTSTRFNTAATGQYGGHGVMQLTQNAKIDTLGKAAALTGKSERAIANEARANVFGAAAVIRSQANDVGLSASDRKDLSAWYEPVARWMQHHDDVVAKLEADAVYKTLRSGISTGDPALHFTGKSARPSFTAFDSAIAPMTDDYPSAHWVPAHSSNYRTSNRPSSYAIDRIIVHTMQGSYAGSISWFQNPSSNVSAHYMLRSSDGDITQMVRDKDVGWHAGNWNNRSIGLEHEGWVDDPSWYTTAMYEASAALSRHICDEYGLAKNRTTIVGHHEVPGATHTDPGPHWDWDRYLDLVNDGGGGGWSVVVDNSSGDFTASSNWTTGDASGQHGNDHRHAEPVLSSDAAWWAADIPSGGTYRVEVWHPADSSNNPRAPYLVATTDGNQTVHVDQTTGGGRWKSLGTFSLASGSHNVVGLSRWTSSDGWLEADAVRISAT